MTLPDSVQVGPYRYSVTQSEAKIDRASVETRVRCNGYSNHPRQEMGVAAHLGPDQQAETILHEVLHAINYTTNLASGRHGDEEIATRLAPLLLDTLRRNPELVRFLVGDDVLVAQARGRCRDLGSMADTIAGQVASGKLFEREQIRQAMIHLADRASEPWN